MRLREQINHEFTHASTAMVHVEEKKRKDIMTGYISQVMDLSVEGDGR